ncbi:hypothetical protein TREMEDRAFT_63073 [Tremella mesenterica DSM 1558]|uniref:uncharacterized protein n=1 Tax=Tremella mesenterica (strain ATCC 24925 / CBS 8224 / DSM 1558 / NBRC 9311 / NRRL Y-6157 / RJB 2259-6 / UBC 559-6) TaxID=578456 RepID=UPI0003F48D11|nr:uncharacterized protein TREMEDRAFT_63073 [Tremella mesenterica DSM 1558]EIW68605.1 hypothetical protein TREMEDRAFT_63073 [Tremella mesenterica DSM 1558]
MDRPNKTLLGPAFDNGNLFLYDPAIHPSNPGNISITNVPDRSTFTKLSFAILACATKIPDFRKWTQLGTMCDLNQDNYLQYGHQTTDFLHAALMVHEIGSRYFARDQDGELNGVCETISKILFRDNQNLTCEEFVELLTAGSAVFEYDLEERLEQLEKAKLQEMDRKAKLQETNSGAQSSQEPSFIDKLLSSKPPTDSSTSQGTSTEYQYPVETEERPTRATMMNDE